MSAWGQVAIAAAELATWWKDRREKKRQEKRERDIEKALELLHRHQPDIQEALRRLEELSKKAPP